MNFYLLSIIAFGVFVAILYLKSSEHQRMLYSQKYVRDKVSGTLGFDKFKEKADEMLQRKKELLALIHLDIDLTMISLIFMGVRQQIMFYAFWEQSLTDVL